MKTALLTLTALALATTLVLNAEDPTPAKDTEKPKPYPLKTCIVTGKDLGSMGDPITFIYAGQELKICCQPCQAKFEKDPAKFLKKLEE